MRVIWELAKLSLTSADPIGVRAIADELDRRKLRTRSGRSFSTTDVHNILHNPVYIGRYIYNVTDSKTGKKKPPDRWHIIPVEPIVDETTFEAVHAAMRERDPMRVAERYAASPMLLSKLARHHKCGGSMTLGMGTGNGGRYRYYECSKRRKIPGSCSGHRIGEILLDNLVLGYLANVLLEPMRLQALLKEVIKAERVEQDKAPRELDALLRRKSDLDGRIGRMHKAIEVGTVNYEERDFRERLDDLKGHRVQVEIQISSLRSGPAQFPKLTTDKVGALATELRFALLNGDLKERRNYLHLFLSRVIVKDHEIELVGNKHVLAQAYAEDWQSPAQKAGDLKRRLGAVHAQVQGGSAISEERIECVGNVGRVHRPRVRRIDRIEYGRAHGLGMQCDQCRGDGRAVGFSVDVPALESKRPPHPSKSATVTLVPKSFSSKPRAVDPAWHAA